MSESKRNLGGRPPKYPGEGKRPTVTFRCREKVYAALAVEAEANDWSISETIERALGHRYEAAGIASDLRQIVREEIAAAKADPAQGLFADDNAAFMDGYRFPNRDPVPVQIFGRDRLPS